MNDEIQAARTRYENRKRDILAKYRNSSKPLSEEVGSKKEHESEADCPLCFCAYETRIRTLAYTYRSNKHRHKSVWTLDVRGLRGKDAQK